MQLLCKQTVTHNSSKPATMHAGDVIDRTMVRIAEISPTTNNNIKHVSMTTQ